VQFAAEAAAPSPTNFDDDDKENGPHPDERPDTPNTVEGMTVAPLAELQVHAVMNRPQQQPAPDDDAFYIFTLFGDGPMTPPDN
jgi:hypothetical protein